MTNGQNSILVYYHVNKVNFYLFFILAIRHVINFHPKDNSKD